MIFTTKFKIGDLVKTESGTPFTVDQIRILTLEAFLVLIEYRQKTPSGSTPWKAEKFLKLAA